MTNKTVIFICTGNTCRSPMAEALFKKFCDDKKIENVNILSRGLAAQNGAPASAHSVTVMKENGMDISSHRATPLCQEELNADLFVCMTAEHSQFLELYGVQKERILTLNIPDPFGKDVTAYRECAKAIKQQLGRIYDAIG